ncbi:DUF2280 domain-containing protein [Marinobacter sp. Hex_13]|uniref:DUF2280 domain-containing protein n=1 Tax=Marinobacter sp. Hex_13 TaxID=1795866 RepID=UPI00079481CB|nr:DUF2280 domain-containing protein [Marinobacter sp. Hex_13]KXJ45881.1 MAG: hypothetical protein AXW11_12385 [Marinobacter sp. Hex_13]
MARLKPEQKLFIVQRLACFDTPTMVAKAVREEYQVELSRQVVEGYDPTKYAGRNLAKKYKQVFEDTREAFLEDTSGIAISHKAVRLRTLQRMAEKAETMGNMVLAKDLLEQAAKEAGDAYSNKRVLEHNNPDGRLTPVINLTRK